MPYSRLIDAARLVKEVNAVDGFPHVTLSISEDGVVVRAYLGNLFVSMIVGWRDIELAKLNPIIHAYKIAYNQLCAHSTDSVSSVVRKEYPGNDHG